MVLGEKILIGTQYIHGTDNRSGTVTQYIKISTTVACCTQYVAFLFSRVYSVQMKAV